MSYKSHRTGPDRVFDHLYDPLYITSGTKDIWKENHNALYRSAPVHIYPKYGTMFTDLPGRPRNYYIQQRNPLPHFPFVGENGSYNNGKEVEKCETSVIGGKDRAKFFNIPLNNEMTMNLQLDIKHDHACDHDFSATPTEPFRTIGCETIYREQSAQTKPWMPDAILNEICVETPELVYAAKTIGNDETPGIEEVEKLERDRRRRQLEKSFARSKYANDWNKRKTFLEALEYEDRIRREEEIDYCQKIRLGMVKKLMTSREKNMQKNFITQMENTTNSLEKEKQKKLNNLRISHDRTLRRLDKQYGKKSRRSKALVPAQKQTTFMSYNTDFEARLDELHKMPTMPTNFERFTRPKIDITKPKQPIKEVKKGFWTDKFLLDLYESLKVIQKRVVHQRIQHPSVESYANELEYQHAVFLQKIIKGRAIQSILHEGKDACQDLINQLKQTFKLESVWKVECCDDWNENGIMECLEIYLDQEFTRYAEQKEIYDKRVMAEQERDRRERDEKNKIKKEKDEIGLDCLEDAFNDFFQNFSKSDDKERIDQEQTHTFDVESSKDIVSDVLSKLLLPEIYKKLSAETEPDDSSENHESKIDENEQVVREHIVKDTIEHLLQKVISHPAENVTDIIIHDILKKVIQLSSSGVGAVNISEVIGGMLDDLCNQLLTSMNETDEIDDTDSNDD